MNRYSDGETHEIENELLQSFFDTYPMPVIVRDLNTNKIVKVNDKFLRIFSHTSEEILNISALSTVLQKKTAAGNRQLSAERYNESYEYRFNDKSDKPVLICFHTAILNTHSRDFSFCIIDSIQEEKADEKTAFTIDGTPLSSRPFLPDMESRRHIQLPPDGHEADFFDHSVTQEFRPSGSGTPHSNGDRLPSAEGRPKNISLSRKEPAEGEPRANSAGYPVAVETASRTAFREECPPLPGHGGSQVHALYDLFSKTAPHIELDALVQNLQTNIMSLTGAHGVGISLYNPEKNYLELQYSLMVSDELKKAINIIKPGDSLSWTTFKTGKYATAVCVQNGRDESFSALMAGENLGQISCYPIVYGSSALGVLHMMFKKNQDPQAVDPGFIEAMCGNIAILLQNALLYRQAQTELEAKKILQQDLSQILDLAADYIALCDRKGNFLKVNQGWIESLGWSEKEMKAMSFVEVLHPEDRHKIEVIENQVLHGEKLTGYELRCLCKNGGIRHLLCNIRYLADRNLFIGTARDVTTQKEFMQKTRDLEQQVQMEALKREFFANLSHEFKTPLSIILTSLYLMEREAANDGVLKKRIHSIKQNSYRLLRLANNMIDMTKIDAGFLKLSLKNWNIVNIIEDVTLSVSNYVESKGISLIFDTDVEEKILACDADKVERVMLNLLSNAVKFTREGGHIKVNIRDGYDKIVVSVQDTGIGIPCEMHQAIFEQFVQGDKPIMHKSEGSGLGLSIVKSLIEMHGGSIRVNSQPGEGTEFIFELPVLFCPDGEEGVSIPGAAWKTQEERISIEFSDIYRLS